MFSRNLHDKRVGGTSDENSSFSASKDGEDASDQSDKPLSTILRHNAGHVPNGNTFKCDKENYGTNEKRLFVFFLTFQPF